MTSLKKLDAILDLLKADSLGNPASPSAGGNRGGPTSAPRGGKYIRRWWESDHWEYEYSGDSKNTASHGVENAWKDDHSLDVPEGAPSHVVNQAQAGDPGALEKLYEHSRENGGHNDVGYKGTIVDPISGKEYQVAVGKKGDGQRLVINSPGEKVSYKATWPAFLNYMRSQVDVAKHFPDPIIKDAQGNVVGEVFKVSSGGKFDEKNNKWAISDKEGVKHDGSKASKVHDKQWKIALDKNNPISQHFAGDNLYRSDPEGVKALRKDIEVISARLNQGAAQPVSQSLAEGKSGAQLLKDGDIPFAAVKTGKGAQMKNRFGNAYDSPEIKMQVLQDLADTYGSEISASLDKIGLTPDVDLSDLRSGSPDSAVLQALNDVATRYSPLSHKVELGKYLAKRVSTRAKIDNMKKEAVLGGGEAGQSFDEAASNALYNNVAAQIAAGVDMGGALDALDSMSEDKKFQYIDAQEKHLDNIAKKHPELAQYTEAFKNVLNSEVSDTDVYGMGSITTTEMAELVGILQAPLRHAAAGMGLKDEHMAMFLVNGGSGALQRSVIMEDGLFKAVKMAYAISMIIQDDSHLRKAEYSHKEGNDLSPKYYYKDDVGNYSKRGNAPKGHEDYDPLYGDAEDDGLTPDTAPQFFTRDGRKLSRAPYTGADVQWNRNYHPKDTNNMWAGRWVNPVTGEHEYTYMDSDLRDGRMYKINRENSLTDNRLPHFRRYVVALAKSTHQKDKTTAVILALLDQGRFRVRELMALRVGEVKLNREIVVIGKRKIHADPSLVEHLRVLTNNKDPQAPLFSVAPVDVSGGIDHNKSRRLGPHFVVNLLDELGVSAEALQTYHASQTYSMEIQRVLSSNNTSYNAAHHFALLEVASEMGHNLDHVDDFESAIYAIEQAAVDPIVVMAIKRTCEEMGIGSDGGGTLQRPVFDAVPRVSMVLMDRTEDEEEFSYWLKTVPIHEFQGN